jgi:hypothetical protein
MPKPDLIVVTLRVEEAQGVHEPGPSAKVFRVVWKAGERAYTTEIPIAEATPERVKAEQQRVLDLLKAVL